MASDPILTIIEHSQISPPLATVGPRSLPLTFFDITWLLFPPVRHIFFYHFPHSKSHFIQTILPNLKHSLSLTLQHFFPFVRKLIVFNDSGEIRKPEIRHLEGDSLALTIAEFDLDFDHLIAHHPRKCEYFYPLVPRLGTTVKVSDYITIPLFSIQMTILPGSGIAIGMTNHHSLGDASTRYIAKSLVKMGEKKGDDELEQFILSVDCRSRLDPPILGNYFGNCGAPCIVTIECVVLSGVKGFGNGIVP
ncbi:hypothetical protein L6452_17344 [Arctium lappa]|uniref:Uncharacterized protein n=1 Tax=Arctium lappa TaxID=4217 RepID=A0ACB9C3D3_ARCLA|nr:hypothetical protein L6452_17344 [Arctium lappa]